MPKAIHGSIPLEIIWSVAPFLVMLVMFAWGTKLYFQNYTPPLTTHTFDIYADRQAMDVESAVPDGATRNQ